MTDLERTAASLRLLSGILAVGSGEAFGRVGDGLFIVASEPAPFPLIAGLTEGIPQVEVVEVIEVATDASRFRSERGAAMFVHDRYGRETIRHDAEDFADHLGLSLPPIMAVMDGRLGLFFRCEADAARYDAVRAGEITGQEVEARPVRIG